MSKLFSRENAPAREPEPESETEPPRTEAPTTEEVTEPPPTSPAETEETTTEEPSVDAPTSESTGEATQEPEKVVGYTGKTNSLLCLSFSILFYSVMSRVLPF